MKKSRKLLSAKVASLTSCLILFFAFLASSSRAQTNRTFDGRSWNISTGNLSVSFIQAAPMGAYPRLGYFMEPPPSADSLSHMKNLGLVANEDYVAWGAVEREPGQWSWKQHDAMEQ